MILFRVMMAVVGVCMGSFLCCQARRMRARELSGNGNGKVTVDERKKSDGGKLKSDARASGVGKDAGKSGAPDLGKWSICMNCRKRLSWWENIPVVSWLILRGRCRGCGAKIGALEIWSEVGVGVMLLLLSFKIEILSAGWWEWLVWGLVVIFGLILAFLAIYDGMCGELPGLCLTFSVICAILIVILQQWSLHFVGEFSWSNLLEIWGGVGVLGGVYLLLYIRSRGRWVGDGDFILAGAIGAVLGSAWLGLIALMIANMLACVVMLPVVMKRRQRVIYFGPFLVAAWVTVWMTSEFWMGLLNVGFMI